MKIFKDNRTFDDVSIPFLLEKEVELAKRTVVGYSTKVKVFSRWLTDKGYDKLPMRKITSQMISEFFLHITTSKDLDRPTIEKYFLHLRSCWQWAKKRDIVQTLPFDLVIKPVKKRDKGAAVIQAEDLTKLLIAIKEKDKWLYLACMMEYYCFIRPNEIRHMKVGDIDFENGMVKVSPLVAKNRRAETVTMPQQLQRLCVELEVDTLDKNLYLFGKKRPAKIPIGINTLRNKFNGYRDMLGITKEVKLYSMKHTGATMLHMSGNISMRELMDQLRHTRLDATQHYVKRHSGTVNIRIKDNFPNPF